MERPSLHAKGGEQREVVAGLLLGGDGPRQLRLFGDGLHGDHALILHAPAAPAAPAPAAALARKRLRRETAGAL